MEPNEYQKLAERTQCPQGEAQMRMSKLSEKEFGAVHAVIGLTGEAGELAMALEHWAFYGKPLDTANISEELGDCLWYIAEACNALGFDLGEVMVANIRKLRSRYPEKYQEDLAEESNRDREAERKAFTLPKG